ncbi:diacylglycerol/lipid kinase family protein [Chloroflexota bacterium]
MNKRIHVVINPAAGQPEPIVHILNDVFRPAGVKWDVSITHEYGDATRQAREAAEGGADIVVAYGGDGTVMEVVNGLVGTEVPLGILPGGTGNVMSVELDIPQTSEAAAQLLVSEEGQIRKVDVGQSGENFFLLRAFVGFDARRIQLATREMRDRFGKAAYLISGLKAMPESKSVRYTLTLDGEEVTCEGFTCIVENAGSMGVRGLSLAPNISVSDGLLDVIVMHGFDPKSLASALGSIADKPLNPDKFHHWQAREITIATDPVQEVIGDGESWGETPITMKVLPGAVRVIAPGECSN